MNIYVSFYHFSVPIFISGDLTNQGVNCIKDNIAVCEFADVLILCILPAQLPQLAKDIKHFIRPDCIVYSTVAGLPILKLSFLLDTTNILTPNLSWNENNNGSRFWNCRENISTVMKTKNIIDKILLQENSGMDKLYASSFIKINDKTLMLTKIIDQDVYFYYLDYTNFDKTYSKVYYFQLK